MVQCPQCETVFPVDSAVLYYDLEKELALAYVPGGLTVTVPEQEKAVGGLTNTLMEQLKSEDKKFYLFNPKLFLSLESLFNAVLEGDGITAEMRATQEAKMKLLQEFLQLQDEAQIREKAAAHEADLDEEFFRVLTVMMQSAYSEGNQQFSQTLVMLRSFLGGLNDSSQAAIDAIDKEMGLVILKDRADLLNRLKQADTPETFKGLIATGHGMLDYTFFQELTATIDQAAANGEKETVEKLKDLRRRVLDTKAGYEQESRQALENSARILKQILQSENPQQTIAENLDQIDDSFFALLSAQIQQAQQEKNLEAAQGMEMLGQMTLGLLQQQAMQQASEPNPTETASSTIEIATK